MCLCSFARVRAACERRLSREIARQRFVSNSNSLGERSLKSVAARLRDNGDVRPSTWCAEKNVFVLRSLVWHRYASSSLSLPRGTSSSPGSWHRSSRDALLTAGTLLAACLETGALRPWTDPLDWSRRPAGNERVARLEHPPVLSCQVPDALSVSSVFRSSSRGRSRQARSGRLALRGGARWLERLPLVR